MSDAGKGRPALLDWGLLGISENGTSLFLSVLVMVWMGLGVFGSGSIGGR